MESKQMELTLHKGVISQVKYNKTGDFIIASSVDNLISLWNNSGDLCGTYEGHKGAVWSVDIQNDTVLSGGGDRKVIFYDFETGKVKNIQETPTQVEHVKLINDKEGYIITDNTFGNTPKISLYDINIGLIDFIESKSVPTSITIFNNILAYSDVEGVVYTVDIRKQEIIKSLSVHLDKINELKSSPCGTFFISSSDDKSAKILDYELNQISTFISHDPVNSSAIFRTNDVFVSAGGISARDVTVTGGNARFDINFYDIIKKNIVGYYSPHFGTINSIDVHPDCKRVVSGGEDAIISVTEFNEDFKQADFTKIT